jgi:hypothetical protein
MIILQLAETQLVDFVLKDSGGIEVLGLGSTFSVEISKNGGAFAAGTGTKAEISDGWYTYLLDAAETDTEGPLAVKVTGAGAVQKNLLYEVSGSIWTAPAGDYILTATEASNVLRCEIDDPTMLALLPQIDAEIFRATGRKWEDDSVICPEAKSPASDLLYCLHEGGWPSEGLRQHYLAGLTRLEAIAQYYYTFEGLDESGYIHIHHIHEGDTVVRVTGRVGATGDQSAKFETVISVDHSIQQISSDDLDDKWFTAYIVPPEEI